MSRMPRLHVVVGVVRDAAGRVLIAQRASHRHQGGLWEFPGGKVEEGETLQSALHRELVEELGIDATPGRLLLRVPHRYPDRAVLLEVFEIDMYSGRVHGREGQPVRWVEPEALDPLEFPVANRPIINALRLPCYYLITPDVINGDTHSFLSNLADSLQSDVRMVQLRAKSLNDTEFRKLAAGAVEVCHHAGVRLLLNGRDPSLVTRVGADGIHLTAEALGVLSDRPLPSEFWVGASCHNLEELRQAQALNVDFAVLSPVLETASHPERPALGWEHFSKWIEYCAVPVYALGGLGRHHLDTARRCRAQGVAGIRAFWSGPMALAGGLN